MPIVGRQDDHDTSWFATQASNTSSVRAAATDTWQSQHWAAASSRLTRLVPVADPAAAAAAVAAAAAAAAVVAAAVERGERREERRE